MIYRLHCVMAGGVADTTYEISSVSPDLQNQLKDLTLENILITEQGRLLTRELATIFINSRTGQSSTRLISDALQAGCSTFCNANDITYYKVSHIRLGTC
jgi:hypothetical protein